jgi:hypothetical protein
MRRAVYFNSTTSLSVQCDSHLTRLSGFTPMAIDHAKEHNKAYKRKILMALGPCCLPFADFFLILINQILIIMSKGQDKKKETKKPATKTLKEKRAEKRAKKEGK